VGPSSSLGEWCYYIRETKFFPWRVTYSDTHILKKNLIVGKDGPMSMPKLWRVILFH
jgi:hypothetical protein